MPNQAPDDLSALIAPPRIAWPTLALFFIAGAVYMCSTWLGIRGVIPAWLGITVNAVAAYALFTVLHDASHRALGKSEALNDWLGRLAMVTLLPLPGFRAFRFIHMQHHRYANEHAGNDPDAYTSEGARWLLPLRWATLDLKYMLFYVRRFSGRPLAERRETVAALVLGLAVIGTLIASGWGQAFVFFWLIPSRLAIFLLALAFDFLPHHPKKTTQRENPWQATNNRVGLEWLLTPLLLSQNYHLVHHLYPRLPFYRYLRLWRTGERQFLDRGPLLVNLWGREL